MIRLASLDMPSVFLCEVYDIILIEERSITINGKIILAVADGHGG
jgi:hypothetical protein